MSSCIPDRAQLLIRQTFAFCSNSMIWLFSTIAASTSISNLRKALQFLPPWPHRSLSTRLLRDTPAIQRNCPSQPRSRMTVRDPRDLFRPHCRHSLLPLRRMVVSCRTPCLWMRLLHCARPWILSCVTQTSCERPVSVPKWLRAPLVNLRPQCKVRMPYGAILHLIGAIFTSWVS